MSTFRNLNRERHISLNSRELKKCRPLASWGRDLPLRSPRAILIEIAMSRKIKRVFRDRPLTPNEVAKDERVRQAIQVECPPAMPPTELNSSGDAEHLRDWLSASEKALREVWDNEEDADYDTR